MTTNKIKIGIIGMGNCASSLLQGFEYYGGTKKSRNAVGLLHPNIGSYNVKDIECVAAFDVDHNKVGKDISEAIFSRPNCTLKFAKVPFKNVEVKKSAVFDGLNGNLKQYIKVNANQKPENVAKILIDSGAEILVNYLPSGSQKATEYFIKESIKANCGFINAIPVFIASKKLFSNRFLDAKLPLVGDDIKSQIGSTIVNRAIVDLFNLRGVKIETCYQSCEGGNTDFINLSNLSRAKGKITSKSDALKDLVNYNTDIKVLPPKFIKGQKDQKFTIISITGKYFGNATVKLQINLKVEDSPDSAGVMVDVIRLMKLAIDNNINGTIEDICQFYFKHPSTQIQDHLAYEKVQQFIEKYG